MVRTLYITIHIVFVQTHKWEVNIIIVTVASMIKEFIQYTKTTVQVIDTHKNLSVS